MISLDQVTKTFTLRRKTGRGLRRTRTDVTAVDSISFEVGAGEFVGYLGPNGAGKSTTIKMLTGILTASSGRIRVAGLDPSRRRTELARRIGVVFGQRTTLWWDLPLADSFTLIRHLYKVEQGLYRERLDELTELLELGPFLATPVRQLSLGQRMRGDLTAALLHRPELVVLDEPTIGLDVVSKATVREFLARINREEGTTVLLTTHDLGDIERLCDRVMVIDHGKLAFDGDLEALRATAEADRTLIVDLAASGPAPAVPDEVTLLHRDGPRLHYSIPPQVNPASVIAQVTRTHDVLDIALREPDIEDVVTRLYTGSPREGHLR